MPKTFLDTIVHHKQREIDAAKRKRPVAKLVRHIRCEGPRRSLIQALSRKDRVNIIAEIKRASPSKGVLCRTIDAAKTAKAYELSGAAAISVLTDRRFFKGSSQDLIQVKTITTIPILRKDFILSKYQIFESAAMGADAILLIVRLLKTAQLQKYLQLCRDLKMEALVEVHSPEDMVNASQTDARLIGINNRDLATFDTQISTALKMKNMLGANQIPVVASGIRNETDIQRNCQEGLNNFLIGESLVRADRPAERLKSYLEVPFA